MATESGFPTAGGRLDVKPDLSVVIVSYNTRELLVECLESLYGPDQEFSFETIIVDNDSSDGTVEAVLAAFPQVRLINNDVNLGFGMAMNRGAEIARGRYLVVLNPDTIVPPETLPCLLDYLETRKFPRVVSCRLVGLDGVNQLSCARFPTPLRIFMLFTRLGKLIPVESIQSYYEKFDWKLLTLSEASENTIEKVDTVLGAFFILPLETFNRVDGFDERFFMHYEEIDLMKKLNSIGCNTYINPNVEVVHYGGQSTVQDYENMRFEQQRSLLLYLHKWHGTIPAQTIRYFLIVLALIRYVDAVLTEKLRPRDLSGRKFRNASRVILTGLLRMHFQTPVD